MLGMHWLVSWFNGFVRVTPARIGLLLLALGILFVGLWVKQAHAGGTWYVTVSGNDANDCAAPATACATINGALGEPGFVAGDTIEVGSGTFTGSGTEVVLINKDVTLLGGWDVGFTNETGLTVIDGEGVRRGVGIVSGVVEMAKFQIQNGYFDTVGSGIYNAGTLTLNDSIVSNNHLVGIMNDGELHVNRTTVSNNSGVYGAGINTYGTTTIDDSTVSDNNSSNNLYGSAISADGSSNIIIRNSTISRNSGGYVTVLVAMGDATLINVTISNNNNTGVGLKWGHLTLQNSILVGNGTMDCLDIQIAGPATTSLGYNLFEHNQDCATVDTDIESSQPFVATLANNGGPTQTVALLAHSPALDAIPVANCPVAADQRGISRPQGSKCDIGAYEATGTVPTTTPTPTFTLTRKPSRTPTLTPTRKPTRTPTLTPTPIKKIIIINEGFEKPFPSGLWQVTAGWGKSKCYTNTGLFSAWSVQDSNQNNCYQASPSNSFNWMIYGPFSLADAKKAVLKYSLRLHAAEQRDFVFIGASVDGNRFYGHAYTGSTYKMADATTGLDSTHTILPNLNFTTMPVMPEANQLNDGWANMSFDLRKVPTLGSLAHRNPVWIGFLWATDSGILHGSGAFVDDVLLNYPRP